MRSILPLLSLGTLAQALYFYIDGTTPKCFFEDLPKDTLVVGHYDAQEYDENLQTWSKHDGISIYISVDVSPFCILLSCTQARTRRSPVSQFRSCPFVKIR